MRILYPIVLGIVLFALMPVSLSVPITQEKNPTAIGSTFIRGFIFHLRSVDLGHSLQFRCLYVHYRTHWMTTYSSGVLHGFQQVTIRNDYLGLVRNHYLFAKFDGKLDITTID
jgi:hypothetical protein